MPACLIYDLQMGADHSGIYLATPTTPYIPLHPSLPPYYTLLPPFPITRLSSFLPCLSSPPHISSSLYHSFFSPFLLLPIPSSDGVEGKPGTDGDDVAEDGDKESDVDGEELW